MNKLKILFAIVSISVKAFSFPARDCASPSLSCGDYQLYNAANIPKTFSRIIRKELSAENKIKFKAEYIEEIIDQDVKCLIEVIRNDTKKSATFYTNICSDLTAEFKFVGMQPLYCGEPVHKITKISDDKNKLVKTIHSQKPFLFGK